MKKLILSLILAGAIAGVSLACNNASTLNLRINGYTPFTAVIDGQSYNAQSSVQVTGLTPGNHFVRVLTNRWNYWGGNSTATLFAGWVNMPSNSEVFAMVGGNNNLIIDRVVSYEPVQASPVYYPAPQYNLPTNSCQPASPAPAPSPVAMADYDFQSLKKIIKTSAFESSKLSIAKQAIDANYVSSMQVKELMQLMSFESSKLEIAKYAYSSVVDKQRFYIVNDVFWFSSSIEELNEYITG